VLEYGAHERFGANAAALAPALHHPNDRGEFRMSWIGSFYRSAIGKKAVMAVSGVVMFGWILAHMAGNLKIFYGAEKYNAYAAWLRVMGAPMLPHEAGLWIARVLTLLAIAFHIHSAYSLTMMNRAARPIQYHGREYVESSYASRTMRWGGVIILLYIVYHLLHLTWGQPVAPPSEFVHGDPYHNVVAGFQVWWVSAIYILANVALGFHLLHGLWSMFNSLGINHPKVNGLKRAFATAFAILVTAGNVSIPMAVLLGFVR
jgi:succinate dehydrogenase / fumarate reductase, cytochrome b subunit